MKTEVLVLRRIGAQVWTLSQSVHSLAANELLSPEQEYAWQWSMIRPCLHHGDDINKQPDFSRENGDALILACGMLPDQCPPRLENYCDARSIPRLFAGRFGDHLLQRLLNANTSFLLQSPVILATLEQVAREKTTLGCAA